jgi:hypothetical protein
LFKHPLAIVCALAFVVGGAAAFVLEYQPRRAAGVQGVAETGAGVSPGAAAEPEAAGGRPAGGAPPEVMTAPEGRGDSAAVTDAGTDDTSGGQLSVVMKGRESAGRQAGEGRRTARGHTRVSSGGAAPAGRGIAGYAAGGVKKTGVGVKRAGAAVGKTFGKIGGVFHD